MDSLSEIVTAFQYSDSNIITALNSLSSGANSALTAETNQRIDGDDELHAALASEFDARVAGDVFLQNALADETAAREAADTTLQNALTAEETDRIAADAALQTGIDTEGLVREAIDTQLQVNIDIEEASRVMADDALQANIDTLQASLATVATTGAYSDLIGIPTGMATEVYVDAAVASIVASAPAALDTLNELATALGSDANFATTVATQIGTKADAATTYTKTEVDAAIADVGSSLATVATTGDYDDLINTPVIPTTISQLVNDSGFVTASDSWIDQLIKRLNYASAPSIGAFAGTVHTASTQAELVAAMTAAAAGDVIQLTADITLTSTLAINKAVKITGGFALQSAGTSSDPVTLISVTAAAYIDETITVKHRKTTNTSIETAIATNTLGFVSNAEVQFVEFGYTLRGSFNIGGSTSYTGPLGNSHRHIAIYNLSAPSIIDGVEFSFPQETTARANLIVVLSTGATDRFESLLRVTGCTHAQNKYCRQFLFFESLITTPRAASVWVDNCSWDDLNGGIGFLSSTDSVLDLFNGVVIYKNNQGSAGEASFKGMVFIDGSGAVRSLGQPTVLAVAQNKAPQSLRTDYTFAVPGVIAYKNTVFTLPSTFKVTVGQANASAPFSGSYNDLTNKPDLTVYALGSDLTALTTQVTTLSGSAFSGDYVDLTNKPTLFSGSYNDLTDLPTTTPASTTVAATAPTGNTGDLWFNTADGRMYVYDGSIWIDSSPIAPAEVYTLSNLLDVNAATPGTGDVLTFDGSVWVAGTLASGDATTNTYTVGDVNNWDGTVINTVQQALDDLAARVAALQNYEIDGGNAFTNADAEINIDGNGA